MQRPEIKKLDPPQCTPEESKAWEELLTRKGNPHFEHFSEDEIKLYYGPAYNHCRLKVCSCHPFAPFIKTPRISVSRTCHCAKRRELKQRRREEYDRREKEKKQKEQEEQNEFIVEKIVTHRRTRGVLEFRVRWEGYTAAEVTWEPKEHFNDPAIIQKYWRELRRKRDGDDDRDPEYRPKRHKKL